MENIDKLITIGVTLTLVAVTTLWFVVSFVLKYHWTRYGIEQSQVKKIKSLYFGISLILFLIMFAALFFVL